jgi:hypothetical protein
MASTGNRTDRTLAQGDGELCSAIYTTVRIHDAGNGRKSLQRDGTYDGIHTNGATEVRDKKRRGTAMGGVCNKQRVCIRSKDHESRSNQPVCRTGCGEQVDERENQPVQVSKQQNVCSRGDYEDPDNGFNLEDPDDGHIPGVPKIHCDKESLLLNINAGFGTSSMLGVGDENGVATPFCAQYTSTYRHERDGTDEFIVLASGLYIADAYPFAESMRLSDQLLLVDSVRTQLWRQCAAIRASKCCHSLWKWHSRHGVLTMQHGDSRCKNIGDAWPTCRISQKLTVALQAAYAQCAHADPHYADAQCAQRVVPHTLVHSHSGVSYSPTDLPALCTQTCDISSQAPRERAHITSASRINVYLSDTITRAVDLFAKMQSIACMLDRCTDTGVIQSQAYTTNICTYDNGLRIVCEMRVSSISEITIGMGIQLLSTSVSQMAPLSVGGCEPTQAMCAIMHSVMWTSVSLLPLCLQDAATKLRILYSASSWIGTGRTSACNACVDAIDIYNASRSLRGLIPTTRTTFIELNVDERTVLYEEEVVLMRSRLQFEISSASFMVHRRADARTRMIINRFSLFSEQVDLRSACGLFLVQMPVEVCGATHRRGSRFHHRGNTGNTCDYICAALQCCNMPSHPNQIPVFTTEEASFAKMDSKISVRLSNIFGLVTHEARVWHSNALQVFRLYISRIRLRIRDRDKERGTHANAMMCSHLQPGSSQEVVAWLGMLYDDRSRDYGRTFCLNWEDTLVHIPPYVRLHSCNIKHLQPISANIDSVLKKMGRNLAWKMTMYTKFDISQKHIMLSLENWMSDRGFSKGMYMLCLQEDADKCVSEWEYKTTQNTGEYKTTRHTECEFVRVGVFQGRQKTFKISDFMWTLSSREFCVSKILALVHTASERPSHAERLGTVPCDLVTSALSIMQSDEYPVTTLAASISDMCNVYETSSSVYVRRALVSVLLRIGKTACDSRLTGSYKCFESINCSCLIDSTTDEYHKADEWASSGCSSLCLQQAYMYPPCCLDIMPTSLFRIIDDQVRSRKVDNVDEICYRLVYQMADSVINCHLHMMQTVDFDKCTNSMIVHLIWPLPKIYVRLNKGSPFRRHARKELWQFMYKMPSQRNSLRLLISKHCSVLLN